MELLDRIKNGEIPPRESLEGLEYTVAQKAVAEVRRLYNNTEIHKAWQCSLPTIRAFFEKYNVVKTRGGMVFINRDDVERLMPSQSKLKDLPNENYLINIERKFSTAEFVNFLERLGMFVNGPDQTYHVKLTIREGS